MKPLMISSSIVLDVAELSEIVGPDLTVTRLPIVSKGLTGQEIAISIILGMAGNAGYAGVKLGVKKLAEWLSRISNMPPSTPTPIQITVSSDGTTITLGGTNNIEVVAVVLEDWARQAELPPDR
jgi:hypothetical protein